MRKFAFTLITLSYLLFFLAWIINSHLLPSEQNIDPLLHQNPLQRETDKTTFNFSKENNHYAITPVFEYELYGLIVSERKDNFIHKYGHKDFINSKDICVVWGDNIENGLYKNYTFENNHWMCFWKPKGKIKAEDSLIHSDLSNNHLINSSEEIAQKIQNAQKGDQIHLKGYLSDYSTNNGKPRQTSTTRDDTGNGACETIYVTNFKILKKAPRLGFYCLSLGSIFLPVGVLLALFGKKKK